MGIANIGAFAQGLMRGDMYANEEKRKKDEQDFLNAQREQTRAQWARDDEERGALAALDRPGVRPDPQAILDQDFTQNETIPTKTVTDADYARGLARAYKYSPDKALAALNTANQFDQTARTVKQQGKADAALDRRAAMIDQWRKDPQGFLNTFSTAFNADAFGGPQHAGKTVSFATTPNGMVGHMFDPSGKHVGTMPLTNESVMALINQLTDDDLATVSPEMFGQAAARGIQRGELGVKQQQADTMEGHRKFQESQPRLMQDGTGRIVSIDSTGTRQLGVFGSARPDHTGSGGGANGAINNKLVELAGTYAGLTPEQQKGPEGQTILRQVAILKAKLDPLTVFGDNKPVDPVRARYDAVRQSILARKDMDSSEMLTQLSNVDKQFDTQVLRSQVAGLQPHERVPELRKLVATGMYTPDELNKTFGFTFAEIKQARKPAAPAAPAAPVQLGVPQRQSSGGAWRVTSPQELEDQRILGILQRLSGAQ